LLVRSDGHLRHVGPPFDDRFGAVARDIRRDGDGGHDEEDGKTRLTLVHENFPSREQRDNAVGGWPGFIDRVERVVAGTRG
jgi:hypothetical protein